MACPVRFLILALLFLSLSGCGYRLGGEGSTLLKEKSLTVAQFVNQTYLPGIEGELRRALLGELAARNLAPLRDQGGDALLEGVVESCSVEGAAFSALDRPKMYRVIMTVSATLSERGTGRTLWKGKESLREEYPAQENLALQQNIREAALTSASRSMARRIVLHVHQAF
jgi:outer membrane lipopolysaccharide assembly protein LptE/RlpB